MGIFEAKLTMRRDEDRAVLKDAAHLGMCEIEDAARRQLDTPGDLEKIEAVARRTAHEAAILAARVSAQAALWRLAHAGGGVVNPAMLDELYSCRARCVEQLERAAMRGARRHTGGQRPRIGSKPFPEKQLPPAINPARNRRAEEEGRNLERLDLMLNRLGMCEATTRQGRCKRRAVPRTSFCSTHSTETVAS